MAGEVGISHVARFNATFYDGVAWNSTVFVDYGRSGAWTECSDGSHHHGPLLGPGTWLWAATVMATAASSTTAGTTADDRLDDGSFPHPRGGPSPPDRIKSSCAVPGTSRYARRTLTAVDQEGCSSAVNSWYNVGPALRTPLPIRVVTPPASCTISRPAAQSHRSSSSS